MVKFDQVESVLTFLTEVSVFSRVLNLFSLKIFLQLQILFYDGK